MRMVRVIILTILSLGSGFAIAASAEVLGDDYVSSCSKVTLAGIKDWGPYTVITSDGVDGIGIELASRVFNDMDIPIKAVAFDNHLDLLQALRAGEIDLLISTYPNNDIAKEVVLIEPEYMIDPITVAVKTSNLGKVQDWEALIGLHGVMDMSFTPDQATQVFFDSHLAVKEKLTLANALDAVINDKAYYVIGSELQLGYAIGDNMMQSKLAIADKVNRAASVHMAFRKGSPCEQYAPLLTKRLQDYRNDGTVDALVNQYVTSEEIN